MTIRPLSYGVISGQRRSRAPKCRVVNPGFLDGVVPGADRLVRLVINGELADLAGVSRSGGRIDPRRRRHVAVSDGDKGQDDVVEGRDLGDEGTAGEPISRGEWPVEVAVQRISGHVLDSRVAGTGVDDHLVLAATERTALVEDHADCHRIAGQAPGVKLMLVGRMVAGTCTLLDNGLAEM